MKDLIFYFIILVFLQSVYCIVLKSEEIYDINGNNSLDLQNKRHKEVKITLELNVDEIFKLFSPSYLQNQHG